MKREIKFRAWDSLNNIMVYSRLTPENYSSVDSWYLLKTYQEVMQYTGLKDKNGKEIYEGDILESVVNYNEDGLGKFLVCFHHGIFFAKRIYEDDGFDDNYSLEDAEFYFEEDDFISHSPSVRKLIQEDEIITIIGNIYENTELLKT